MYVSVYVQSGLNMAQIGRVLVKLRSSSRSAKTVRGERRKEGSEAVRGERASECEVSVALRCVIRTRNSASCILCSSVKPSPDNNRHASYCHTRHITGHFRDDFTGQMTNQQHHSTEGQWLVN